MSPWLFLTASVVGAGFTLAALIPARQLRGLVMPYFLAGWLAGELPWHHIGWQALATAGFVAFGALEAWPGQLGLAVTGASWCGLLVLFARGGGAAAVGRAALADLPDPRVFPGDIEVSDWIRPFRSRRPGVERVRNLAYREAASGERRGRNRIDVIRPRAPGERRPALLQVHGGGWVIGDKKQQGQPLMHHLAERGWVCFAQNYRLAPRAAFPAQVQDVKRAIAWIREHGEEYGADPDFLCITGGSAGGHLASLAALSPGDPAYQPGFEAADTSVAACVPFYGVYDLLDRQGLRGAMSMAPFLQKTVLQCSPDEQPELWENGSPITRVQGDAPPFFVVHGTHDSLVFVEEARAFVKALREKSRSPVLYAEYPGAQHAFDTFHSRRSAHAVRAVTAFLEHTHRTYLEGGASGTG